MKFKHKGLLGVCIMAFVTFLAVADRSDLYLLFSMPNTYLPPTSHLPRVVVSMTSFSDRILFTGMMAINSILQQPYDLFIISIPEASNNEHRGDYSSCLHEGLGDCIQEDTPDQPSTPDVIVSYLSEHLGPFQILGHPDNRKWYNVRHTILLQFLPLDYGPATKLLGALLIEKDPSTLIITVDDDIEYDPGLISMLAHHAPPNAALSPVCQMREPFEAEEAGGGKLQLRFIHDGTWHRWIWPFSSKICPGWLVGWAGVAYRVGHFGADVFTELNSAPHGCLFNDDVWLSGYLKRRGVERAVMPWIKGGRQRRHPTKSLSAVNDTQVLTMQPCLHYYGW